jgi:hypothetical protein
MSDHDGSVRKAGELVAFVKECVENHGATPHTEVYVRRGKDGPMERIAQVKMMRDDRGQAIILETSTVLVS